VVVALGAQDLDLPRLRLPQVLLVVYAVPANRVQGAIFPGRRSALARTMASQVIILLDVKKMEAHGAVLNIQRSLWLRNQKNVLAAADAKHVGTSQKHLGGFECIIKGYQTSDGSFTPLSM